MQSYVLGLSTVFCYVILLMIYMSKWTDYHGTLNLKDGKYREALGKWEAALNLMPESAILNEQKAQVLLEIGDAWNALKAATRMAEFLFSLSLSVCSVDIL